MDMARIAKPGLLAMLLCIGPAMAQEYGDELADAQKQGDYAKALRLVQPEAEKGLPEAQYSLGRMYALGQGVERDEVEAARWYHKAAEQGVVEAQYQLGEAYAEGNGVPQDYVKAYRWMSRAAKGGYQPAEAAKTSFEELMSDEQLEQARQSSDQSGQGQH